MAIGAGRYDHYCTQVREETRALGAIVIVFKGWDGDGFSCQLPPELVDRLPAVLRGMADDIEADAMKMKKGS